MMGQSTVAVPRAYEREEEFAAALASLEPAAWRQLFDENYQRVHGYAYLRTGNAADADDIAANVFTEAVKGIRGFRYRGTPVAAWIFRIAHHETADHLKRRARQRTTSLENPEAAAGLRARDGASPDEWRDLADALAGLKPAYRDVLLLRLVEGRSVSEAAKILGKSEGAVKVTQMRALKAVRSRLSA
jgi:RNA polymerase sigma-70 factor, ECF subfamily